MEEELARLREEVSRLKKEKQDGKLVLKVSEKGCLSIYGLNRFPVSLYKEQWLKVLNYSDEIRAFITENNDKLATK